MPEELKRLAEERLNTVDYRNFIDACEIIEDIEHFERLIEVNYEKV